MSRSLSGAASVRVRTLTGAERDAFEQSLLETPKNGARNRTTTVNMANARAKLCALSVVDSSGERVFTDADVESLGQKSGAALDRVFSVAQRLSGISDDDVDKMVGDKAREMLENPLDGSSTP